MTAQGHQEAFLRVRAKRRLSVQSRDLRGDAAQRARRAVSGHSPNSNGTARLDPQETYLAIPPDRRVEQKAVIRVRLLGMPTARSRQPIEQLLRFLQVGRIEALGEPVVNRRQQIARFGAPASFAPQPGEARRGT